MHALYFPVLDSSNLYLKANHQELPDLTFVRTGYQSAGRGSHGRDWTSKEGENLLFSILVKRQDLLDLKGFMSLLIATGVASFLENEVKLKDVSIKWPNDIYVNGKKVCGILIEGQYGAYLTIGIGLNVNQKEFLGDYRRTPTSLALESGKSFDLDELAGRLFPHLEGALLHFESKDPCLSYFASHNFLKGKKIAISEEEGAFEPIGVDEDFALICRKGERIVKVSSGEIRIL